MVAAHSVANATRSAAVPVLPEQKR